MMGSVVVFRVDVESEQMLGKKMFFTMDQFGNSVAFIVKGDIVAIY